MGKESPCPQQSIVIGGVMKTKFLAAMTAFFVMIPSSAHAASSVTFQATGMKVTIPKTFKLKTSNCSLFPVKYSWTSGSSSDDYLYFNIYNLNGDLVGEGDTYRNQSPKSGTVQVKVCRKAWKSAAYDEEGNYLGEDEFSPVKKGKYVFLLNYSFLSSSSEVITFN